MTCGDPDARDAAPMFASALGEDWAAQRTSDRETGYLTSAGVAVDDLDGDGLLDIFLVDVGACQLFLGQPDGTLAAREVAAGCGGFSVTLVDVDGDRDLDVAIGNREGENQLLINDGSARFTDEAEARGFLDDVDPTVGVSAADIDGDGDLDLFTSNHRNSTDEGRLIDGADTNVLYYNDGDGFFTADTATLDVAEQRGFTFAGLWVDADLDDDPDLYLLNDFGSLAHGNRLLENDGGTFTAVSGDLTVEMDGMGAGVSDYNGDGIPDLALSDWGTFRLLLSAGDGAWYDAALASGVTVDNAARVTGWGVAAQDLNNDGRLDIVSTFGPAPVTSTLERYTFNPDTQPDALWLQGEDGRFEEVSQQWGLDDKINGRGVLAVDLDGDGWLDVVKRDLFGGPALAQTARCGSAAWLSVRLQGSAPNTQAVGARVDAWVNGQRQRRWIMAGDALASSGPPIAHFGLGDAAAVERLEITWPDGAASAFEDIAARQQLIVVEDEAR